MVYVATPLPVRAFNGGRNIPLFSKVIVSKHIPYEDISSEHKAMPYGVKDGVINLSEPINYK